MGSEQNFEYRVQKILEGKDYLVINCTRSRPFDLVAIKGQIAFPLEVKSKNTSYPDDQKQRQIAIANDCNTCFFVVEQSKKKGKMKLSSPTLKYIADITWFKSLEKALEEHLE